jgi:hypothetical protein
VSAKVVAIKTSSAYKYGRNLVNHVRIVVPGSGGIPVQVVSSGVGTGSTKSDTGVGWARSTVSKTASEILADNNSDTYIYGSTYSQRFKLDEFSDPLVNTGHILKVTWRRSTSANTTLTLRLLQGALLIAAPSFTQTTDGDVLSTYTLTGAQADLITDYSNLYIEFYADYQAVVSTFLIEVPLPGANVKTRSVTGTIKVVSTVKAQRPPIIGHPMIGRLVLQTSPSSGIVAIKGDTF